MSTSIHFSFLKWSAQFKMHKTGMCRGEGIADPKETYKLLHTVLTRQQLSRYVAPKCCGGKVFFARKDGVREFIHDFGCVGSPAMQKNTVTKLCFITTYICV